MPYRTLFDVKDDYARMVGRQPWLRGIGIGRDRAGYFIKVNTSVPIRLPPFYEGVRVFVDVVGDIRAL
jgi:hypothetical protein